MEKIGEQTETSQLIFRSYQLLFSQFNQCYSTFAGVAYVFVNTIIITFTYEIIVYSAEIHVFVLVLGIINLQLMFGSGLSYQVILRLRNASIQFVSSHYKTHRKMQRRVDTAFWKSCNPIEVWIGGIFTISSRNFLLFVFCEIILTTSINLMLTFPKKRNFA